MLVLGAPSAASGASLPAPADQPLNQQPQTYDAPSVPIIPSLPPIPKVPSVTVPKAPSVGLPGGGGGGVGRTIGGGGGGVGGGFTGTSSANSAGRSPAPVRPARPSGGGRVGASVVAAGRKAHRRSARRRAAAAQRRLQREVRRLTPCFSAISRLERAVLVLRAGLGGRPALGRRAVASRLGVRVGTVAGRERRGLRGLRSQDRSSGCSKVAVVRRAGRVLLSADYLPSATGPAVASALAGDSGASRRGALTGRPAPGGATDAAGTPATAEPALKLDPEGSGPSILLLLGLSALVLALAALVPGYRMAGAALTRRSERAADHRRQQLVAAVSDLLGDEEPDDRNGDRQAAPARRSNGHVADGHPANRHAAEGQTASGHAANGQTAERQAGNGQAANGQTAEGQKAEGQAGNGQAANGRRRRLRIRG